MLTHVQFRSNLFPAFDGEELEVNPGVWGARLADFVSQELSNQGFETDTPFAEDWGWVVPIRNNGFRLWVGCGHLKEHADEFLCFIEPHKPFVRKLLKKVDTRNCVSALQRALDQVLGENAQIYSKRWSTYDEFNCSGQQSQIK